MFASSRLSGEPFCGVSIHEAASLGVARVGIFEVLRSKILLAILVIPLLTLTIRSTGTQYPERTISQTISQSQCSDAGLASGAELPVSVSVYGVLLGVVIVVSLNWKTVRSTEYTSICSIYYSILRRWEEIR